MNRKNFISFLVLTYFPGFLELKNEEFLPRVVLNLAERTKRSTVHLINHDEDFVSEFSNISNKKFTLQIFDISKIKISKNKKIGVAILKISSMDDFEKFYKMIKPENFLYNGYYIIFAKKEIEMEKIFAKFWKIWIFNVNILIQDSENFSIFTFMPFNDSCNSTKPIEINQFNSTSMKWKSNNFFPEKFKNLHGCDIKIGSYKTEPGFMPQNNSDGTTTYTGIDVEIVYIFASLLHFTPKFIEKEFSVGSIFKNKTATGLLGYAYRNEVDFIETQ
jgi:hypothetical protein